MGEGQVWQDRGVIAVCGRRRALPSWAVQRRLVIPAVVLAALLLALALVYLAFPANDLPSWFPGYDASLSRHHPMRAAEMGIVAVALLLYAWVQVEPPPRHARENSRRR